MFLCVCVVPGMGNTSPKDMDTLLPLMNMVIYSIDKVKKLRLNREVGHPDPTVTGSLRARIPAGHSDSCFSPCGAF